MKVLFCMVLMASCSSCEKGIEASQVMVQVAGTGKQLSYLALGDSYTIGESVKQEESYPYLLSTALSKDTSVEITETRVIAKTGWTTADLQNSITSQSFTHPYDLVTLLIGVNNQYQGRPVSEYETQFTALLQKAISLAGGDTNKVVVISIPDYGYTPFGAANQQEISTQIDLFNGRNKAISAAMHVTCIDITPISRNHDPSLVAGDGLHPSGKQYVLWVDLMLKDVRPKAGIH